MKLAVRERAPVAAAELLGWGCAVCRAGAFVGHPRPRIAVVTFFPPAGFFRGFRLQQPPFSRPTQNHPCLPRAARSVDERAVKNRSRGGGPQPRHSRGGPQPRRSRRSLPTTTPAAAYAALAGGRGATKGAQRGTPSATPSRGRRRRDASSIRVPAAGTSAGATGLR
jgi:hypothetical protein